MAKLTFLGAAGCVTGSKYLVEAAGKRLLLDCGIFQGAPQLNDRNYERLSVDPRTIDYCVLTHAHLDHTGWLPVLVKDGFKGPIYANPATIDLTTILLKDSAHIQEEDTLHAQKHGYSRHANPRAMYMPEDVEPVLKLMKTAPRTGAFSVSPEFSFVAYDAGHILGSTSLVLTIHEGGKNIVVVFSGDIGRYDQVIMRDPVTPPVSADVLLCESTYGDREHQTGDPAAEIAAVVNRVAQRGGVIVIPSFAVGRTQTFMYYLRQLEDGNQIPRVPVYIDSPMALSATELYLKYAKEHDSDFQRLMAADSGKGDPLDIHEFHLTKTVQESKAINQMKKPCIIVSASGMASGGRVLHHLEQRLPDGRNAVLLAGFQAEGSRGRALQDGAKSIHLYGHDVAVNAEIISMGQLSAHAGKSELLCWLGGLPSAPRQTYLTHGEPQAAKALQSAIRDRWQWKVEVAGYLQTVGLG